MCVSRPQRVSQLAAARHADRCTISARLDIYINQPNVRTTTPIVTITLGGDNSNSLYENCLDFGLMFKLTVRLLSRTNCDNYVAMR